MRHVPPARLPPPPPDCAHTPATVSSMFETVASHAPVSCAMPTTGPAPEHARHRLPLQTLETRRCSPGQRQPPAVRAVVPPTPTSAPAAAAAVATGHRRRPPRHRYRPYQRVHRRCVRTWCERRRQEPSAAATPLRAHVSTAMLWAPAATARCRRWHAAAADRRAPACRTPSPSRPTGPRLRWVHPPPCPRDSLQGRAQHRCRCRRVAACASTGRD